MTHGLDSRVQEAMSLPKGLFIEKSKAFILLVWNAMLLKVASYSVMDEIIRSYLIYLNSKHKRNKAISCTNRVHDISYIFAFENHDPLKQAC